MGRAYQNRKLSMAKTAGQKTKVYSKYKKDGTPYKRSKRLYHTHGSGGELINRIEHRAGHCSKEHNTDFNIHITDDTKRLLLK